MSCDLSSGPDPRTPKQLEAIEVAVERAQRFVADLSSESIARAAIDYYLWEMRDD